VKDTKGYSVYPFAHGYALYLRGQLGSHTLPECRATTPRLTFDESPEGRTAGRLRHVQAAIAHGDRQPEREQRP
jgi:hypothetical protein